MRPLKTILILNMLIVWTLALSAQPYFTYQICQNVSTENFHPCKEEILSIYDDNFSHLELTREQLETKVIAIMRSYLGDETNEFCEPPSPSTLNVVIDNCSESVVQVSWPSIEEFKTLKAATISFKNGELDYLEETTKSYLFSITPDCVTEKLFFTTIECDEGTSSVDVIIIAEKDIRSNGDGPSALDPVLLRQGQVGSGIANVDFQIAPNPIIGNRTNIIYQSLQENPTIKLHTYNAQGKLVLSKIESQLTEGNNYTASLNFEGLSAGIYFVVLEAGSDLRVQKIVKQ